MSDFRPETKVAIDNLTNWDLYFSRIGGVGDIKVPASVKNFGMIPFEEIQMQIQTGNVMFIGSDGIGSHARLRIVDDEARATLFGMEEDVKVDVLTLDAVKALLAIKAKPAFNKRLGEMVTTDAEKRMIVELAKQAGAADAEAWKVEAIEKLSGYSLTVTDDEDGKDGEK